MSDTPRTDEFIDVRPDDRVNFERLFNVARDLELRLSDGEREIESMQKALDANWVQHQTVIKARQERDAACAYAVDILALLKAAKCPNAGCWDGAIPSGDREDPDWSQCQWCYERDAALAKSPNPSGQLTVEASAAQAGRAAAPGLDTEASGPVGLGPQSPCPCCGMCHGPGLSANAIITAPVEPLTGRCRHEDSHDGLPCMECGRTATPSSGTSTEHQPTKEK